MGPEATSAPFFLFFMEQFAVAGLGNPGKEYEHTRHNAGFLVADKIADIFSFGVFSSWKKEIESVSKEIWGKKIWLLKPVTYMNNSGEPLKKFSDFHGLKAENIILIFDDVSLEFGKIRLRKNGSAGGHNGVKSVIENFGTQEIKRVKIGIGPVPAGPDMKDFVLGRFSRQEETALNEILERAAGACEKAIREGVEKAMNAFNS